MSYLVESVCISPKAEEKTAALLESFDLIEFPCWEYLLGPWEPNLSQPFLKNLGQFVQ